MKQRRADLDDFVACYGPGEPHRREESERFKRFSYDELLARDKVSLDVAAEGCPWDAGDDDDLDRAPAGGERRWA